MKRAIGYVRVSTSEQAIEGISLDNQNAKIRAYCVLNNLELAEVIEDAGKSGKNLNREGIQALLKKVKKFDAIVVYKLDRLSRKTIDILNLIETIRKAGVAFHSLNEKIDTGTAMGQFFLTIIAAIAQIERDLISERTRDVLQMKIANGERAGQVPYGYRLSEDGNTLIKDKREQEAITLVRRLRAKGHTYQLICDRLTNRGYRPMGRQWYPQTIKNILRRAA